MEDKETVARLLGTVEEAVAVRAVAVDESWAVATGAAEVEECGGGGKEVGVGAEEAPTASVVAAVMEGVGGLRKQQEAETLWLSRCGGGGVEGEV